MIYEDGLRGELSQPDNLIGTMSDPDNLTGTLDGELIRGYSAYEIAVQNGFEGTEEEWLASLKGEKGDTGDTGERGDAGEKGDTGDSALSIIITPDTLLIPIDGNTAKTPTQFGEAFMQITVMYGHERVPCAITIDASGNYAIPSWMSAQITNGTASADGEIDLTWDDDGFVLPELKWMCVNIATQYGTFKEYIRMLESVSGVKGDTGETGPQGDAYVLTAADKVEIYELLLAEYPAVEEVSF